MDRPVKETMAAPSARQTNDPGSQPAAAPLAPRPPRQFSASWIWCDDDGKARNVYALFRRRFRLDAARKITLHATADNFLWLHVDGRLLLRGPVRSDPAYRSFDSLDLQLDAGDHALAVLAHHVGEVNACMKMAPPGLLVEVEGMAELSTGPSWKCVRAEAWRQDLPGLMSHYGFWEELDLRKLPFGWTDVSFDDSSWHAPHVVGRAGCPPWTALVPRDHPPFVHDTVVPRVAGAGSWIDGSGGGWRFQREFDHDNSPAKEATQRRRTPDRRAAALPLEIPPSGRRFVTFDCGAILNGYVGFSLESPAEGAVVDVSYDDRLAPGGFAHPTHTYVHSTDRYTLDSRRTAVRSMHPRAFRYLTLDIRAGAEPVRLAAVRVVREATQLPPAAPLELSDDMLSRAFLTDLRTQELCVIDCVVDTPIRERVQWVGCLQPTLLSLAWATGDLEVGRRGLFAAAHSQRPDGCINSFSPTDRVFTNTNDVHLWLPALLDYYEFRGRDDDVRALLPTVERLLRFFDSKAGADGLVDIRGFWDWSQMEREGCLLVNQAFLSMAYERMSRYEVFRPIGRDFAAEAARLRRATHERLWLADRQVYSDTLLPDGRVSPVSSQHANIAAVLSGICPPERRGDLLRYAVDIAHLLPEPVGEAGMNAFGAGELFRQHAKKLVPYGMLWWCALTCEAFFQCGLDVEAVHLMRQYYGPFDGRQCYPEVIHGTANTVACHNWGFGPSYLIPRYILGISPAEPGWGRLRFAPCFGDLSHASGEVRTPRGTVHAAWTRRDDAYELELGLPPGVTAEVPGGVAHGEWTGLVAG